MAKLRQWKFEMEISFWHIEYPEESPLLIYKAFFRFDKKNIINTELIKWEKNQDYITIWSFWEEFLIETLQNAINYKKEDIWTDKFLWTHDDPEVHLLIIPLWDWKFKIEFFVDFFKFSHKYKNGALTFCMYQNKDDLEKFIEKLQQEFQEFLEKNKQYKKSLTSWGIWKS